MSLKNFTDGIAIRKYREKLGMNQTAFWSKVHVMQSAASRYETGRNIPVSVGILLKIAYADEKAASATYSGLRGK